MKTRIIFLIIFLPIIISAQIKLSTNHASQNLNCSTCHSCEIPTKENPCLKACPRESMIRIDQKPEEGPRVIKIDKIKETDIYEPSIFSHLAHAEMAEMSGGCRTCHHYNPPGNVIGCSDCHEAKRKREDVSKPDLKGAFHRLCMDCHRSWSGKTECISCHPVKGTKQAEVQKADKGTKRIHPEIKTPDRLSYKTNTPKGKLVTFNHGDHTNLFGYECSDCHNNDSCIKCHSVEKSKPVKKLGVKELHKKCSSCHDTNSNAGCSKCHSNSEKGSFNHKLATGFDNAKFHSKLSCQRCHTVAKKFGGLKAECSSCHGSWTNSNFGHKVTGLVLDEIHAELECENCHKEPTFAKQNCEDCHDDKTYPNDKPGKLIKR